MRDVFRRAKHSANGRGLIARYMSHGIPLRYAVLTVKTLIDESIADMWANIAVSADVQLLCHGALHLQYANVIIFNRITNIF